MLPPTGHDRTYSDCCPDECVLSSLLSVCDPETGINVKFQNTSCTLDPVSLAKMSMFHHYWLYMSSLSVNMNGNSPMPSF